MDICIFYSWQSKYKKNCDNIISKALNKAVKELNAEQVDFQYDVERGGGDVLGAEHIDNNIDKIINTKADIAIVDFTHNGEIPQKNPNTGEWIKQKCSPNTNATYEDGKLEVALGERLVFKVYNIAYGDLKTNLDMPFDLHQEHFPIPFYCDDNTGKEERTKVVETLTKSIKGLLEKGTKDYMDNQKVRYAPLVPLRNEFVKKMWNTKFWPTHVFIDLKEKIATGISFRLLGLPGLGKTRMVGESFRGRDNDVYYCDCKNQSNNTVQEAVEKLLVQRGSHKQVVILDNCTQQLCGYINDSVNENGFNCQLITINYDPSENLDSGIEGYTLKVDAFGDVVKALVDDVSGMSANVKESIIELSGGFPLMAAIMIENFQKGTPIANVSKKDVFERMLGVDPQNATDQDKIKVLTAFSIFKFIGLYGSQEKQGRFIAGNRILSSNLKGSVDENLQLFKNVHGQYEKVEILEQQGNLVLMRLMPLAIYLCKSWFDKQTTESITTLIQQIKSCDDVGTRKMIIESLSRRITLLNEVPLAKELNNGLTDPDHSPFLNEEVVLSALGSRLFLAFSEVNPEACAFALYRIIAKKSDKEIANLEPARRNLAWALDHLAFDGRSFRNAMLTLARFSLVETEVHIANNTTGLFVDRFAIMLPGTEVNLMTRVEVLKVLSGDERYFELIKQSLDRALSTGHFHRTGGAEKQGIRTLKDYNPSYEEVMEYYNACFGLFLSLAKTKQDLDEVAKTLAKNARGYYMQGMEDFLFHTIEVVAPKKDYTWEEMKDALSFLVDFDAKKRNNIGIEKVLEWEKKLTKEDYVYTLLHIEKDINRHFDISFEKQMMLVNERYGEMAKELVDKRLYEDHTLMTGVMRGDCLHYNSYGLALSSYSKEVGLQEEILNVLIDYVLHQEVSRDAESMLVYFILNVTDGNLLEIAYSAVLNSEKKRLLPAIYAIKAESDEKLSQLFDLLDKGELTIKDFSGYFNYRALNNFDVKYVARRLLDYGAEGAELLLSRCYNFLFGDKELDADYEAIARKCLIMVNLNGYQMNDFVYLQSMNNYLVKHRDEELALHIQALQENGFEEHYSRDNYYLGQLYGKVLKSYTDLLKPRVFELLEEKKERHSWFDLLSTSYSQETGLDKPLYTLIPIEDWFDWLHNAKNNDRAYALAMVFSYSTGGVASDEMFRLIEENWCEEVKDALSARLHSYSWTGTGIPLYRSRIALYEDFIARLTNEEAREWFKKDIAIWEKEIEQEILNNAHERAIYD